VQELNKLVDLTLKLPMFNWIDYWWTLFWTQLLIRNMMGLLLGCIVIVLCASYLASSVYLHVNPFWNGKHLREFQQGDNVTTTCKDGYLFTGPGFFNLSDGNALLSCIIQVMLQYYILIDDHSNILGDSGPLQFVVSLRQFLLSMFKFSYNSVTHDRQGLVAVLVFEEVADM
jgi:hypothetical protein